MNNNNQNKILYILEIVRKVLWIIPVAAIALLSVAFISPLIEQNLNKSTHNNFIKKDFIGVIHVNSIIDQPFVDRIIGDIQRVSDDPNLAGFLFIFSSPGGEPSASHNFMSYLKKLKKNYEVYGYINSKCTSGCYYSAIGIDKINTNKNSIVGSVGVLMQLIDFSNLSSKIGVNEKTLTVGDYKKPFSSINGISKENEQYITDNMLTPVYNNFVDDVINERNIEGSRKDIISKYFNGKVFIGNDQRILNVLVDQVIDFQSFKEQILNDFGKSNESLNFIEIKKKSEFDIIDKIQKNFNPSANFSYNLI